MTPTQARSRLRRLILDTLGGYERAAVVLKCSRDYLYMLTSGTAEKKPSLEFAVRLERRLGIPACSWVATKATRRWR